MAESKCLALLAESNRPYNVQGVADMLASQGFKKAHVEKALAGLAEDGRIRCKEFGKTKIYIPNQNGLSELDPKESERMLAEIAVIQQQCKEADTQVVTDRKELAVLRSGATRDELEAQVSAHQQTLDGIRSELARHRAAQQERVTLEDLQRAEKQFNAGLIMWERLRRIFRDVWDTVSENIETNQADLFDEIGVDTDEAVGEALPSYQALFPASKKCKW